MIGVESHCGLTLKRAGSSEPSPVEWARHWWVRLTLPCLDGEEIRMELLGDETWLLEHGASVGGTVFLNMPEMGVEGEATVEAIEPCPPIEPGHGRVVTGTFHHSSGVTYDLKLKGEPDPIGVTASHPIWSVDQNCWTFAADLSLGESVRSLTGAIQVESLSRREAPEPVVNVEVEGDHVYRVGETGSLAHNQSSSEQASQSPSGQQQPDHVFATGFGKELGRFAADLQCEWPELSAAFADAQPKTQTPPFDLKVTRTALRPDPHSEAFGKALTKMRDKIASFKRTAASDGNDKARKAHKNRLQAAWQALVNLVEDPAVSNLVAPSQRNLVSQGRQILQQIQFDVAQVIDKG